MKIKINGRGILVFISVIVLLITAVIFFAFWRYNAKQAAITTGASKTAQINQEIEIPIEIETAGAIINAAEIYLTFDPAVLKVESVSKDNSIFQLWITDEPRFDNAKGEISFAGGLPTPGFSGRGRVGAVKIIPLKKGLWTITFDQKTRVLLNDGVGTAIKLNLEPIEIKAR